MSQVKTEYIQIRGEYQTLDSHLSCVAEASF